MRRALIAAGLVLLCAPGAQAQDTMDKAVPRATCGPGSQPESSTSLQGEVPVAERDNGRSLRPYTCNTELVGKAPSEGAGWQTTWVDHCAYYGTNADSALGTQVVDVKDPANPKVVGKLQTQAMLGPWESLSTAGERGMIGAVDQAGGALYFDMYDVKDDCTKPKLLFSGPITGLNHEGNFSMDGRTYYASGLAPNQITALDVDEPSSPSIITTWVPHGTGHGLATNPDGTRLYLTELIAASEGGGTGSRLTIWDTSMIQARMPGAAPLLLGQVSWTDGTGAQHPIWTSYNGKEYVVFVDELGNGAARMIDISDESAPKVVSKMKLEVQMPEHADRAAESAALSGSFGYNAHYCGIDRQVDPTALACSYFASGVRIFDIRDPLRPREIAYYNPGGTGEPSPPGSQEGVEKSTSGYPSARIRFIRERGEIWFTDQNKGFHVVKFTNGVWPPEGLPAKPTPPAVTPPVPARTCFAKASVALKLPRREAARSAVVTVNGKVVKRVRGKALRAPVKVKLPAGKESLVRLTTITKQGKRVTETRRYARCAAS